MLHASLVQANLTSAILPQAELRNAALCSAQLNRAVLSEASLYGAILRQADLSNADLRGADLRYADLYEADLTDANLTGARLNFATMPDGSTYNQGYVQPVNPSRAATPAELQASPISQYTSMQWQRVRHCLWKLRSQGAGELGGKASQTGGSISAIRP